MWSFEDYGGILGWGTIYETDQIMDGTVSHSQWQNKYSSVVWWVFSHFVSKYCIVIAMRIWCDLIWALQVTGVRQKRGPPVLAPLWDHIGKIKGTFGVWVTIHAPAVSQHSHWLSCAQGRGGCWVPIIPCGILPEELLSITMNLTKERERQMGTD